MIVFNLHRILGSFNDLWYLIIIGILRLLSGREYKSNRGLVLNKNESFVEESLNGRSLGVFWKGEKNFPLWRIRKSEWVDKCDIYILSHKSVKITPNENPLIKFE